MRCLMFYGNKSKLFFEKLSRLQLLQRAQLFCRGILFLLAESGISGKRVLRGFVE